MLRRPVSRDNGAVDQPPNKDWLVMDVLISALALSKGLDWRPTVAPDRLVD